MKRLVKTSTGSIPFRYETRICPGLYMTKVLGQHEMNIANFDITTAASRKPTVFQKHHNLCIIDHIHNPMTRIQFLVEKDCDLRQVPPELHQMISPALRVARTKDVKQYADSMIEASNTVKA